ncbi:MAG: aminotransferase class V-fold PLP-dependent enzyme [Gemmatimonadales bacterium]
MLTAVAAGQDAWFTEWRRLELARVDRAGLTYLDYGGAALYPSSLLRADLARLDDAVLGNPHSEHAASRDATADLAAARSAVLDFLHADPREYGVIFAANASAACRLVGEAYPFDRESPLVVTADNHNSVNGLREFAKRRGATVALVPLDEELRLRDAVEVLAREGAGYGGLFAFPAQSNFSGVRHSLDLIDIAQELGYRVLLDAAAYLPTMPLDLTQLHPDFVVLSIYKIAGYPNGVGALVARHDALAVLRRPWFAGGTVEWVSTASGTSRLRAGVDAFEDGTVPFLSVGAVPAALALVHEIQPRLREQLTALTDLLLSSLGKLRHQNGAPMVTIHGPTDTIDRGATVAFTVLDPAGKEVPFGAVERRASDARLALRGGCFCNPGCAERALDFPVDAASRFEALGGSFNYAEAARALGRPSVGALRVSLGLGSVQRDVDRLLEFLRSTGA